MGVNNECEQSMGYLSYHSVSHDSLTAESAGSRRFQLVGWCHDVYLGRTPRACTP
jgi:hypothetical protein